MFNFYKFWNRFNKKTKNSSPSLLNQNIPTNVTSQIRGNPTFGLGSGADYSKFIPPYNVTVRLNMDRAKEDIKRIFLKEGLHILLPDRNYRPSSFLCRVVQSDINLELNTPIHYISIPAEGIDETKIDTFVAHVHYLVDHTYRDKTYDVINLHYTLLSDIPSSTLFSYNQKIYLKSNKGNEFYDITKIYYELYNELLIIKQKQRENEISLDYTKIPRTSSFKFKTENMAEKTTPTKLGTVREIETSMINKEEVFRILALSEATGLPLLLVGKPGVGKTKTVIEYAKAWLNKDGNMSQEDFMNKIYILETDEGTKASEIKGMPDLGKLFTENHYEVNAPVADADLVVINEVDKASSAIRNAMLGVMNEKFLFNGKHKIPCKWKLFVATCNEIPKEEKDSPFWDRFMIKLTVNRISAGELSKYYAKGGRKYNEKIRINIPTKAELDSIPMSISKLEKYLEVGYNSSTDRTLTFVPLIAKAISVIWNVSIDKALVKTAQVMIGSNAGSELQNKLISPEVKNVLAKVEMLKSYTTHETLKIAIDEIEGLVATYTKKGNLDMDQVRDIESTMNFILEQHPCYAKQDLDVTSGFINAATPSDISMADTSMESIPF